MKWTEEMDQRFQDLAAKKLPFSHIATVLNEEFGLNLTRNAVIGRSHRTGIRNGRPSRQPPRQSPLRIRRLPAAVPLSKIDDVGDPPYRCTLLALTNETCRWPLGSGNAVTEFFCGTPTADLSLGRPYCPSHAVQAKGPKIKRAQSLRSGPSWGGLSPHGWGNITAVGYDHSP